MSKFLPNLGILRNQIGLTIPNDKIKSNTLELDLLPYALEAAHCALLDFNRDVLDLYEEQYPAGSDASIRTVVGPGGRNKIGYRIDSFFEASRRAQNAIIPYLSKSLSLSLSPSLSTFVKKIEINGGNDLPKLLLDALLGYWQNHGNKLKNYRDLSQHYGIIVSEVILFRSSDDKPAYYVALPNNPEVKNPNRLSFENPTVHAGKYMSDQFRWLILFAHYITTQLTQKPDGNQRAATSVIVMRTPYTFGSSSKLDGHHFVSESEFNTDLQKFLDTLEQK